ncbi:pyridoxal phosphate-dependent aminotransferase [Micropruina sonneratiae]|uniref:pyridoxal phosphate-dependent aminotransferase n=1 Tax=Micropruina sonneratiae TaxID=2986940 RepID=UPI0022270653|nr:aminotransferase class I/II-fold pyridoxal phosphate-dependent enzyme [Micropruina sp. KQZ13P-5]MCW3157775.1 aminotransferase class I/II-fold pyridoxal phosphate-dependent enzyme [Micropruina sp. KQZ13P-5]
MEVLKAVAARRRSHDDVILLCVGQPATPAPSPVLAAAEQALRSDVLGYTEAVGTLAFRTAIAGHYRDQYDLRVTPDEIVVTTGSSGGFLLALLAAFDPGDLVAITRPGYPAYRNDIVATGCRLLELDCGPATRYQPTVAMLEALDEKPAGLVIASPANPTGTIIGSDELGAISAWCADNGVLLISDEIYHGISVERSTPSAWGFNRDSVVVGSLSKYQSMTGWRVGWLLLPEALRRPVELLQGNLAICAPAISQAAGVAAFGPDARAELDGHVRRYAANRDILLARLPELGITSFAPPDGAFYAWCDIGHLTDDSQQWCADVLAATGVALTPGIDFDPIEGHRFMRLSFCGTGAEITEGINRLVAHLG